MTFRGVLDSASESPFLTIIVVSVLGLKNENINISTSLNYAESNVNSKVTALSSNHNDDSKWNTDLLIVQKIIDFTMYRTINISVLNIPQNLLLANPKKCIHKKRCSLELTIILQILK